METTVGIFNIKSEQINGQSIVSISPGDLKCGKARNKCTEWHENDTQRADMRFADLIQYAEKEMKAITSNPS